MAMNSNALLHWILDALHRALTLIETASPRTLALTAVGLWAADDFRRWRGVEGGFPLNPLVWALGHVVKHTLSTQWATERYVRKLAAHPDARRAPELGELPQRAGPTPTMIPWGVPHRHVPQLLSPAYQARTAALLRAAAETHGLLLAPSVREAHSGLALYSGPTARFAGDLLHTHPADASAHVTLLPRDAAEVLQKGWGAPFPFANLPGFDPGLVLVWAPRDEEEMLVLERILQAGVQFVVERAEADAKAKV